MLTRSSADVGLVRIYSRETVSERLAQSYRAEIRRLIQEVNNLPPSRQEKSDEASYENEAFTALVVQSHDNRLNLVELEALLERLLWHKRVVGLAGA